MSIRPASSVIGDGITLIEVEQNRLKIGFSFGEAVAIALAGLIFLCIFLPGKIMLVLL
ncbi:hypothetical protein [uncultured Nostoc sp.]|uniref:hypothetical protein n=1 Tax=uncultured Nostoc sp. TaxID=340711 RepID=UPI0035CC45AB